VKYVTEVLAQVNFDVDTGGKNNNYKLPIDQEEISEKYLKE